MGPQYVDAVEVVLSHRKASPSLIQRKLKVPYSVALKWVGLMEDNGICTRPNTAGHREIRVAQTPEPGQ